MAEIASLQRHIVLRMGDPAVQFLSTQLLPSAGLSPDMIQVRTERGGIGRGWAGRNRTETGRGGRGRRRGLGGAGRARVAVCTMHQM